MSRALAWLCGIVVIALVTSCSTDPSGSPATAVPLSSCDATAPTGKTRVESFTSGRRTVQVHTPVLDGWGSQGPTDSPRVPGDGMPPPGLDGMRQTEAGYVQAVVNVDFTAPVAGSGTTSFRPRTSAPESWGYSIDEVREGTVCGQPATLTRQHPTSGQSYQGWLRGELVIRCACGGPTAATVVVKLNTDELDRKGENLRRVYPDRLPSYPSQFESDIARMLANVQVTWKDTSDA